MEVSPYDPHTIYYGSQYLHRSRDGGVTWEKISPDLTAHPPGTQGASGEPITRDATGEEVYSTLYAIRESPRAERPDLDRLERRPGLRDARRRQDLDQCDAEGPAAGRARAEHRAEPAPRRERPTSRPIGTCWAISRLTFTAPTISARPGRG